MREGERHQGGEGDGERVVAASDGAADLEPSRTAFEGVASAVEVPIKARGQPCPLLPPWRGGMTGWMRRRRRYASTGRELWALSPARYLGRARGRPRRPGRRAALSVGSKAVAWCRGPEVSVTASGRPAPSVTRGILGPRLSRGSDRHPAAQGRAGGRPQTPTARRCVRAAAVPTSAMGSSHTQPSALAPLAAAANRTWVFVSPEPSCLVHGPGSLSCSWPPAARPESERPAWPRQTIHGS